jgi:cell division protein FtsW (lipid II flippase)
VDNSAYVVLLVLAAIGLLAQWASGKVDDIRHRHWILGVVWAVLAVIAFAMLSVAVPAGQEEIDRQIHRCELVSSPGCPHY